VLFERRRGRRRVEDGTDAEALYGQIRAAASAGGVAEKKVRTEPVTVRWGWIEPDHPAVSLAGQCQLLGLSRSTWYEQASAPSGLNVDLMRRVDEEYTLIRSTAAGG